MQCCVGRQFGNEVVHKVDPGMSVAVSHLLGAACLEFLVFSLDQGSHHSYCREPRVKSGAV